MSVNPPRPSLPPLNALRAFESAARLGGFKQAAGELNVSAGAVAQHIKGLEAWCGGALFERHAQGVSLSDLGRQVLPDFVRAFDEVSLASQKLRKLAAPNNLAIATLPSVAQLLLAPWLPDLRGAIKGVQISVTAMETPPNLAREPFDISLFFTPTADTGQLLVGPDALVPVCAPELGKSINSFTDLMGVPHISDQFWPHDWADWTKAAYPDQVYSGAGPSYSLYSVAVQEAVNGGGVLMGHRSLVTPLLARGDLVVAVDHPVPLALFLTLHRSPITGATGVVDQLVETLQALAGQG
ncbi:MULTISPECIES: LysR family transcriptional regulator [Rhodobacterales]|uniref:LysR family transcriptional regulator n=1 Tax=Roseobacter sp. N2S TaxID=2663844 RepID=UPI002861DABC|nr:MULTISPECIES: LysR family transcriptional regulator [Rhodobacterales]MDR6266130.1 LysR family glycine cleavage system transcriptional activator [Roseobacter sp. N2S]